MGTYTNKIVKIADKLNANFEGFTIGTEGEKPKKKYIVGGYNSAEYSFMFCPANKRGQKIFDFVENYFLFCSCNPVFFGIWYDQTNKYIYLDICKEFDNLNEAKKEGQKNNQICIFDTKTKKEIYLYKHLPVMNNEKLLEEQNTILSNAIDKIYDHLTTDQQKDKAWIFKEMDEALNNLKIENKYL